MSQSPIKEIKNQTLKEFSSSSDDSMASENEEKMSKTSNSTTDLSDSRGFQATSTPSGSVKGFPPTRVASEPVHRATNPPTVAETAQKSTDKVSGIFTLKKLNETFPPPSNLKGN